MTRKPAGGKPMPYKTRAEIEKEYREKLEKMKIERAEALGRVAARDRKADAQAKIRIGGALIKVLRETYESYVERQVEAGHDRKEFEKLDSRDVDIDRLIAFLRGQEKRGNYFSDALGFPSAAGSYARSQRKED